MEKQVSAADAAEMLALLREQAGWWVDDRYSRHNEPLNARNARVSDFQRRVRTVLQRVDATS